MQRFKEKLAKEFCSEFPNAFGHNNKHEIELRYNLDFREIDIPTKAISI